VGWERSSGFSWVSEIDVIDAIEAAVLDGVDVIGTGVTFGDNVPALSQATQGAAASGVPVVVPAGNQGPRPGSISLTASAGKIRTRIYLCMQVRS
jgi:hypothetical protein